ncbi:hypothetical protein [Sphingomonas sp.]|jgi:hypothetical protein|uniref:hypothetical protein n=1 Tax=Sphingomonas sp. TaxID=28214 RepID=UPI002E2EE3ED|nr:hypothetical protein [Sphingomonas sp.]HEX4692969.1 hypothetical protein [Sphingomonas sp.]
MKIVRILASALLAAGLFAGLFAGPTASAQFFLKSYDFRGSPVAGTEPELGMPMPGATPAEIRAGLVWNLRAALNVAALQCDFEPTLMTVDHYNAMIRDHKDELKGALDTLNAYFVRTAKTKAAGQTAFDRFGTRTYSAFATVAAQYGFCQTASKVGTEAIFAPRGELGNVAVNYMRELRNSLVPWGEQQFPRAFASRTYMYLPDFQPSCWRKGVYNERYCGSDAKKKRR